MRYLVVIVILCQVLFLPQARAGSVELPIQVGGAYSVPTTSIREGRFAATMRQQFDFSCGSAALATLLTHHYGHPVGEDQVFTEMFRLGNQAKIRAEGFSLLDMKRYLEAHGFSADGYHEPLTKLVEANVPAIVLINEAGYNHFVVVKGLLGGRILFGDPAGGTRAMPIPSFEAMWMNKIVFVVGHPKIHPGFNLASDWQAAPFAPLGSSRMADSVAPTHLPKLGPADF